MSPAHSLDAFNSAERSEAIALLRPCLDIARWCASLVDGRPYASVGELVAAAESAASPFTVDEVDGALAQHPRIGERPAVLALRRACHAPNRPGRPSDRRGRCRGSPSRQPRVRAAVRQGLPDPRGRPFGEDDLRAQLNRATRAHRRRGSSPWSPDQAAPDRPAPAGRRTVRMKEGTARMSSRITTHVLDATSGLAVRRASRSELAVTPAEAGSWHRVAAPPSPMTTAASRRLGPDELSPRESTACGFDTGAWVRRSRHRTRSTPRSCSPWRVADDGLDVARHPLLVEPVRLFDLPRELKP